ncbi:Hpt domain-containing protein, partial [uncultured Methylobacterium sp.]|uniref:Hpt domain-containing protein n=1 Tax=uncultured Methylobacterium sp. TaxID=157278 RepID=UPI0026237DDA
MTSPTPVEVFRAEAAELLERLEATLLDLAERPDDRALVDTAFRALHTLKGSGAMFGFERLAAFTHDLETAFDLLRQGRVTTSRDLLDVALAAKDHIRALVDDPDAARPASGQAILARLGLILGSRTGTPDDDANGAGTDGPGTTKPDAPPGWRLGLAFDPALLRNGTNPLALLDELRDLGPCTIVPRLDALPDLDALDPESLRLAWDVVLPAGVAREAIEDVFLFVRDDMTLALDPIEAPPAPPGQPERSPEPEPEPEPEPAPDPAPRPAPRRTGEAASLRVEASRLDELMDRVGELVIAQAR